MVSYVELDVVVKDVLIIHRIKKLEKNKLNKLLKEIQMPSLIKFKTSKLNLDIQKYKLIINIGL